MSNVKNIDGRYYPDAHPGWGAFAEELFHYTSRYYKTTEAFLCSLAGQVAFSMSGYKAARLNDEQRELLAMILSHPPQVQSASDVIVIVEAVINGGDANDADLVTRYLATDEHPHPPQTVERPVHFVAEGEDEVDPLDPFLSLAERLLMPVAVHDRHVEISLRELATHLQSPNSTLRTNLHNAVITLHNAGYVLRNHPHLTHSEAHEIGDDT